MTYAIIACSPAHIARKRSHMAGRKFVFFMLVALIVMSIVNLTVFSLKTKRSYLAAMADFSATPSYSDVSRDVRYAAEVYKPSGQLWI